MQCRICFEEDGDLLTPCQCRGTSSYIHRTCLDQYIRYYPDRICRVCHTRFGRYESPRDVLLSWSVFSCLVVLLFVSSARLLVKLALFGVSALLSFYFLRRNLFSTTPLVCLFVLMLLFLPGGHPAAAYMWLVLLGGAAFLVTLTRQIPEYILLGIVITLILSGYIGFLTFFSYIALDSAAFTVYLSVLYLSWYAWLYGRPLDELRLRLA